MHCIPLARDIMNNWAKIMKSCSDHICNTSCIASVALIKNASVSAKKAAAKWVLKQRQRQGAPDADQHKIFSFIKEENNNAVDGYQFPPQPSKEEDVRRVIWDWSTKRDPAKIMEKGCCVCGLLCPVSQLTKRKQVKNLLEVLVNPGMTRMEKKAISQATRPLAGPVIHYRCDNICSECRPPLRKGDIPSDALANGFWIGDVPAELADLSFMEKILIQRRRANRCFICVASGAKKMIAHAIAFDSPVSKVYDMLPPNKEDLEEVLVILFTDPNRPTGDDWKRSPVLVRKNKVIKALEWL